MTLLECVPNVSEGRRTHVIEEMVASVRRAGTARLLDISSDPDHNRSVLTLVGEPGGLLSSLLALYEAALGAIDLNRHRGVHPRLGVVDVVPFVPLDGNSMSHAASAALSLGQEVAERFRLPVYLYEQASQRPWRRNLADLRRGGLPGLASRIRQTEWQPDFGPARVHPTSGVTLIGARSFLIAFNVRLASRDVEIAKRIARSVRESSGGLPGVKAMGVYLESRGCAQVSLNLVDYRQTSMFQVLERIRHEASASGTRVAASEIVGLVPEEAVRQSLQECLELDDLPAERLLEQKLRAPSD